VLQAAAPRGRGETADAPVSDTGGPGPWGFDSLRPHSVSLGGQTPSTCPCSSEDRAPGYEPGREGSTPSGGSPIHLREQGIVLIGGGADEAPEVYKRLPEVLDAHANSIRVKHTLHPLGVAMAGGEVFDPYKD
jgi:hypothetical protein